jgi:hypothetical protein
MSTKIPPGTNTFEVEGSMWMMQTMLVVILGKIVEGVHAFTSKPNIVSNHRACVAYLTSVL